MRNSSIELARIVAMVAIVIYHFVCHGVFRDCWPLNQDVSLAHGEKMLALASAFIMFGTDLFAIISGFFRIRLRWKTILGLWFLCLFYNILNIAVQVDFSVSAIGHCFFISSTQQWYFASYLWIVLLSPIINAGIDSLSKNALRLICILCIFLCGFSGWFLENVNTHGHSFDQILAMYIVGAGISKENQSMKAIKLYWYPVAFLLMGIMSGAFISIYSERGLKMLFFHNNPFTMIAAISVFCFFNSLTIKSGKINRIASSTPAVLLLSDMVFENQLYSFVHNDFVKNNLSVILVCHMACLIIAVFIVSFFVDLIRQSLFKVFFTRVVNYLDSNYPIPIK